MPDVIASYFNLLRRCLKANNFFFCVNRAEKIMFPSDHVQKSKSLKFSNPNIIEGVIPIRFAEYPWNENDRDYFYYECKFLKIRSRNSHFVRAVKMAK